MTVDDEGMQCLCSMLGVYELGGYRFGAANAAQLKRDAATVAMACRQAVGMGRKGDPACKVTASEFDGAVVRILGLAMLLAGSGALDHMAGGGR